MTRLSPALTSLVFVCSACSSSPGQNGDASAPDSSADAGTSDVVAEAAMAEGGDAAAGLAPMPIISRSVPAYASSGTASDANDASYDTEWRSNETTSVASPSWLAYDLSGVPSPRRQEVDVVWYSNGGGYAEYDLNAKAGAVAYNEPRDYTLEGNAAPGGTLPSSGWVVLTTVVGSTYISRQQPLSLAGYNWIRMHVTAINGTTFNLNTAINLDVHDTSQGMTDSWLFLGDSITAFAMRNDGAGISASSYAELVNTSKSAFFPAAEGAGEGGWTSGTPLTTPSVTKTGSIFDDWLKGFPGRYVCLSYGTNDGADGPGNANASSANFETMIQKTIAAGKIPCIPHVPWAEDAGHQTNAQLINAAIDALYAKYPTVVKGPDLYAILRNHPELYQDSLHPNPQGREVYRHSWATSMLGEAYP